MVKISSSPDSIKKLRDSFINKDKKTLKSVFKGRKAGAINNLEKFLKSNHGNELKVKDALILKSVFDRDVKNNQGIDKKSASLIDSRIDEYLLEADFSLSSLPSKEFAIDMRMDEKNGMNYQDVVEGQIKRDYPRGGVSIVDNKIFKDDSDRANKVERALVDKVKEYSPSLESGKIKKYVQRAMIMGTQHVINDAFMEYFKSTNIQTDTELSGLTKFSVQEQGVKIERQSVYEKEKLGNKTTANETIFYAYIDLPFEKYLQNEKEFSEPQEMKVNVKVYTNTQDIH
ncbi:hypothetical protein [uncultured Endozoicomonas sp.]|uniref:hypothetical protein n=1 Tax=uncultured Endozoicomonas sp. TaxID=432652 RepID=UPI0026275C9C|nr:hypothetical protein [uncultured Endozoicomonas sp.]